MLSGVLELLELGGDVAAVVLRAVLADIGTSRETVLVTEVVLAGLLLAGGLRHGISL